jgi:hypothetical protein
MHGKRCWGLPFSKTADWREPIDLVTDCYFCLCTVAIGKNRETHAEYHKVRSMSPPVKRIGPPPDPLAESPADPPAEPPVEDSAEVTESQNFEELPTLLNDSEYKPIQEPYLITLG